MWGDPSTEIRTVDGGVVGCPDRRQSVGVELCWRCPWLVEYVERTPGAQVACGAPLREPVAERISGLSPR